MTEFAVDDAVTIIHGLRETTFARTEQSISMYIRTMLASLLRKTGSSLQYVVCGVETCKSAWNWAHGFAEATSNRVHAEFNRWWRSANPVTSLVSDGRQSTLDIARPTQVCDRWLLEWLVLATHNPPNAQKPSVPKLGASILYPQYTAWCTQAKDVPIQIDGFRGRLSIVKRSLDVATRASKQGSAECPVCSVLKRAEASATGLFLKSAIKRLYADHLEFTNGEVNVYVAHAFEAKDNPKVISCMFNISTASLYVLNDFYVCASGSLLGYGWGRPICP